MIKMQEQVLEKTFDIAGLQEFSILKKTETKVLLKLLFITAFLGRRYKR